MKCCEFMMCGKELARTKAQELGLSSPSWKTMHDRAVGSGDAGPDCCVISGTVCDGTSQRSCMEEISDCMSPRLYDYACNQERQRLENSSNLLRKLHTEKLQPTVGSA
ncbi:MAG: two-CW domain-containing protein [Candidatus Bathyarchaeia archaeon]